MEKVFVVYNIYQGFHYFASTKGLAQKYIDSKIDNSYGSSWATDCWQILEQPINDVCNLPQGE